ncbi:hypothetical protein PMAYCL1PPCAC_17603, partial [Pristionchus mayeri]
QQSECVDINECKTNRSDCHEVAKCTNTIGSYSCVCQEGFEGDPFKGCTPIDKCKSVKCDGTSETCKEVGGKPTCVCKDGFVSAGETCKDVNECLRTPFPCHKFADCEDTVGSYTCICKLGYIG